MDCSKSSAGAVAGLPDDPLVEILSRVPAKSVCRFKCVSKAWRDLIADNRNKLPQAMEGLFYTYQKANTILSRAVIFEACGFSFVDTTSRSVPLDIDTCFSFLTELPEIRKLFLLDSCNGLILLHHCQGPNTERLGYIVCNPTTKQWQAVPHSSYPCSMFRTFTHLAFDPAVSSHFHLVQFEVDDEETFVSMHAYSSEIGAWSRNLIDEHGEQGQSEAWHHQFRPSFDPCDCTFFNGILHLVAWHSDQRQLLILAVDVQGKARRMITVPFATQNVCYFGQSQGLLHFITQEGLDIDEESYKMSIWVLQDYDRQEWVLKHSLSSLQLFVDKSCGDNMDDFEVVDIHQDRMPLSLFDVVDIHRDCNVVFFAPASRDKLIAYDMDSKEANVIATFGTKCVCEFARYVPYFSESPALTNKQ